MESPRPARVRQKPVRYDLEPDAPEESAKPERRRRQRRRGGTGARASRPRSTGGHEQRLWRRAGNGWLSPPLGLRHSAMCEALAEQLELSASAPPPECGADAASIDSEPADPLDTPIAQEIHNYAVQAAFLERRCAQRLRALSAAVGAERAACAIDKAYETEMDGLGRLAQETLSTTEGRQALRRSEGAYCRTGIDPHMGFAQTRQCGDNVEAITNSGEWNHAIVLKVITVTRETAQVPAALLVRFPFWGAAFDECIEIGFGRIAPLGTNLPVRRFEDLVQASAPIVPQNPMMAPELRSENGKEEAAAGKDVENSCAAPLLQALESAEATVKHFNLVGGKDCLKICYPGAIESLDEMPGRKRTLRWTPDGEITWKKKKESEASDLQKRETKRTEPPVKGEVAQPIGKPEESVEKNPDADVSQPQSSKDPRVVSEQRSSRDASDKPAPEMSKDEGQVSTAKSEDGRAIIDVDALSEGSQEDSADSSNVYNGFPETAEVQVLN